MKRLLPLLCLFLLISSCEKIYNNSNDTEHETDVLTKGNEILDPTEWDTDYFVTFEDVEKYLHFRELCPEDEFYKREFPVINVTPLGVNELGILCYVINYHDGWEIISADKRTPIVLAQSDSGYFDIAMMAEQESSQGPILWLSQLALGVYYFRSTSEIEVQDKDIEESIQSSILFWLHVTNPEAVINCQTKGRRGDYLSPYHRGALGANECLY